MENWLYIEYYRPPKYTNKLLVIGLLRKWFGFKLFLYIKL